MNKLEEARLIINNVDKEMIRLFKERMKAASMVASYKKENNLPVFDETREKNLISKNKELLDSEELEPYYLEFLNTILKVSKEYQVSIIEEE